MRGEAHRDFDSKCKPQSPTSGPSDYWLKIGPGDNLEGMNYGVIHHVVFDKGFGFIKPDRGPDIFFPAIAVQDGRFNFIGPEQPVKYELEAESLEDREKRKLTKKGPRAKIVILIDKIPGGVLEDPPPALRAKHHPNKKGRKATWKRKIDVGQPMDKLLPEVRPMEEQESGDGSQESGDGGQESAET